MIVSPQLDHSKNTSNNTEGSMQWGVSQGLIEDAKREARLLIENGEKIRPVPFGDKDNFIFVTTDAGLVTGTDIFELDGKKFFVGWKR